MKNDKIINFQTNKDNKIINKYDIDKILKHNGKFILICNIILILCIIISLLLVDVTDSVSLIIAIDLGMLLAVGIVIDIVNRIRSMIALKKYNLNEIKEELASDSTRKLDGLETYLTENYIVSNATVIRITKYEDIEWAYLYIYSRHSGIIYTPVNMTFNSKIRKYPIAAYLKNGKGNRVILAVVKNDKQLKEVYSAISKKNKKVIKGYTKENIKKYEKINKLFTIENIIGKILLLGLFVILIIGAIYNNIHIFL